MLQTDYPAKSMHRDTGAGESGCLTPPQSFPKEKRSKVNNNTHIFKHPHTPSSPTSSPKVMCGFREETFFPRNIESEGDRGFTSNCTSPPRCAMRSKNYIEKARGCHHANLVQGKFKFKKQKPPSQILGLERTGRGGKG